MNLCFLDEEEQFKSDFHQLLLRKKEKLGHILRETRENQSLLQREVITAVGITRRNLTSIENGRGASLAYILRVLLYYQAQGWVDVEKTLEELRVES